MKSFRHFRHEWTWRRELVELAILFMAVGTAGLFTEILGRRHYGWMLLLLLGASLFAASTLHWWWKAHGPGGLRPGAPFATVVSGARPDLESSGWGPAAELDLWRVRAVLRDRPGSLAAVCAALAHVGVNIVGLQVHPLGDGEGVLDEFLLDVPAGVTAEDLDEVVTGAGGITPFVSRASAEDLTDAPARVLALAARLTAGTAGLPVMLHDLFGECAVGWLPGEPREPGYQGTEMLLADPDGGTLRVTRDGPGFTPAEFARAQALVALRFEVRRVRVG